MKTNQIIQTKLYPPMVKHHYIRKASVMKNLQKTIEYPLTILHSGAGYGKSTALSLYMHDFQPNYCWYTISASDDDFVPFIRYLVFSIRMKYPSFGEKILHYFESGNKYFRDEDMEVLNALFIKELASISETTILVLDDFHLIDHSFSINRWLENLIASLPPHIHFVLASRMKPRWQNLTKWKVTGKLLEIDERELALSSEDIALLFADYYEVELHPEELRQMHELTEGWVIAISLIGEQLQRGSSLEDILKLRHSSINDLFDYLALEVFANLPPLMQNFIEQVAVLEEITPDFCDRVLGFHGSEGLLEQLLVQNAFIDKLGGTNKYRFHSLFKTAMEKRLKEENKQFYRQLNERIAQIYENENEIELAVSHYEKAENEAAIARILSEYAEQILQEGKLESLLDMLKNLTDSIKNEFPALWYYEGEVLRYLAYYEKAKQRYEHLIECFEEENEHVLLGRAYEGIAKIYVDTIQPYQDQGYLRQAITIFEKRSGISHPETRKLYALMAENLINLGRAKLAEKWIEKGALSPATLMLNNLDARLLLRTGKLQQAHKLLEKRLEEEHTLPQTHRENAVLLSYIAACLGFASEAKNLATKGIEHGLKYKNSFVEACGWMRLGNAQQLLAAYPDHVIEQCYTTSLKIMETIDVPRGKAEPYMGLSLLYSYSGKYEQAKELAGRALYETEKVQDSWLSTYIRLCLGIAHFYSGDREEADGLFSNCQEIFKEIGDAYGYTLCAMWLALASYQQGEQERFQREITIFLQELKLGEYEFLLSRKTLFAPRDLQNFIPLLLKAKEFAIETSYINRLLEQLGYQELDSHPGYTLKITTFGAFTVYLGNQPIYERDWQRIKARELLQFLIVYQDRWWTREEIYEQLWPDVPEKRAEQEFKVIINSLNKTLEPHRKARSAPFFIIRNGQRYKINPRASIDCDFIQFEHWIREGLQEKDHEKARSLLQQGIHLYQGEFLPDMKHHVQIAGKREYYRELFLRGAERLAQLHVQQQQFDEAIHWCEQILAIDRTWEESYRLLMYCYYQKNNRPRAIKYYRLCYAVLQEELGVEPLETTKQMYELILEAEKLEL